MSTKPLEIQSTAATAGGGGGGKEGLIVRFILAPLAFLSFILSLALVDSRNTYLRTKEHSQPGVIQSVRGYLHGLVFRRRDGREGPYDYVRNGVQGKVKEDGRVGKGDKRGKDRGVEGKGEEWYWHTKQRKMMKRQFDDAFEMRNTVAVGVVAVFIGVIVGVGGLVGWGCGVVGRWMEGV